MNRDGWVTIATFQTGLDADIAMSKLEAEGIPSVQDRHDSVGILGFGFQGATNSGFALLVPEWEHERALMVLNPERR